MLARVRDMGPNIATDHTRWTPPLAADPSEWPGDDVHPVFVDATEAARPGLVPATTGWFGRDRLIADLARRLATIETGAIDDAIVDSFRQIGQALALDRIVLWRKSADTAFVVASHHWIKNPQPSGPESLKLASLPFVAAYADRGEVSSFTRIEEVSDPIAREAFLLHGLRSAAVVPLPSPGGDEVDGILTVGFTATEHEWPTPTIDLLRLAAGVIAQTLARQASATALQRALDDLDRLRKQMTQAEHDVESRPEVAVVPGPRRGDRLQTENVHLRCEVQAPCGSGIIIGQTPSVRRVLEQLQQVATTDATVLLLGETGTGKELLATHLHELSARRGHAMVRVNCSAIPATLMESELFGREKGAFTGALARQIGRFELADRSTIFLDEIGDVPADVQVKLLRVLEERQIERLGSPKGIHVDVRIVAATHRNLEQRITEGTFREDLFYRLNVFPIQVPPLRERVEDIPLLVWRFVDEFSKTFGKRIDAISRPSMAALQRYAWPGNIRELRNVVERAMIVATGSQLTIALPTAPGLAGRHSVTMSDVEREHMRSVLDSCGWHIRGSGGAAERLGLRPTTLETRMAKLGLSRPKRV
jgi:formate hydrogenlyase transcriptional activator